MRRAAVLVAVAVLAAACAGTPGPVAVPSEDIPFGLARSPSPTATAEETREYRVYFVRRGLVVAVRRNEPAGLAPAEAVVRALIAGPTASERARGIQSRVPPDTRLLGVRVVENIAEVDLSGEFQGPASSEEILLRVAQVVWTLARLQGVTAVRFLIDGEPVSVVIDDGTAVERPVTIPDYENVSPARATP